MNLRSLSLNAWISVAVMYGFTVWGALAKA